MTFYDDVGVRRLMASVCERAIFDASATRREHADLAAEAFGWLTSGPGVGWLISLGIIRDGEEAESAVRHAITRILARDFERPREPRAATGRRR